MKAFTHFIEVYKSNNYQVQGPLSDIRYMERNLKMTAESPALKTIAVFKIAYKPSYILAKRDEEINATIIESV